MSACLFIMSATWFMNTPIDQIEAAIERWEKAIDAFDHNPDARSNRFLCDQYSGFTENVNNARFFLLGVKRGKE